ncbi:hypothetical protein O3M35_006602 [Rhynocoris fuscipes]|uniref:Uncharacterized protein n=1 Tax=Rhynocoris fuscipes TaxID=488301 RepID=A0AAW1DJX4_9HEMI
MKFIDQVYYIDTGHKQDFIQEYDSPYDTRSSHIGRPQFTKYTAIQSSYITVAAKLFIHLPRRISEATCFQNFKKLLKDYLIYGVQFSE